MPQIAGFYQPYFEFTKDVPFWNTCLQKMTASLTSSVFTDLRIFPHSAMLPCACLKEGDRECVVNLDGVLFNREELLDLLSFYHLSWDKKSDAEILINGYLALGISFFSQLNGAYAFALYDSSCDTLLLVRDLIGSKPLFYQFKDLVCVFSSRQNALFSYGIKPEINKESLAEIFGLGPARSPGHGIFKDMKEVLPGHCLLVNKDGEHSVCYTQIMAVEHKDAYEETLEKISFLLEDSIRRQLPLDSSVCSLLSGGIDSSLVSAFAQKILKEKGLCLDTYSFDFAGSSQNFKPNSFQSSLDRPYVDIMVNHIGSHHYYLECDTHTQIDYLEKAVDARDLPCMADVESSLLYFCGQVANRHKVALTGECADEIFGGYPWFHNQEMWRDNLFPWSNDLTPRTSLLDSDLVNTIDLENYVQKSYASAVASTPSLEGETPLEAKRREIAWLNIRWFMVTLLNRMHRTSSCYGLDARVPFADRRILQYVFNIPWDMKCHNNLTKSLLIEAGSGLLPEEILNRKKSPYPKTYDPDYEKLLGKRLMEVVLDPSSPVVSLLNKEAVTSLCQAPSDYGRPWYGQLMAAPQMMAYLLQVNYWMKKYHLSF